MKKLLLIFTLLTIAISGKAQSKSVANLKDKNKNHDDFFQIELGGNFMNFADGFKINMDKNDMVTVAKSVEKLNFFNLPEGVQTIAEYKSLQKGLKRENYDLLMEAAEGKSGVMIYGKGARSFSDLVILIGDEKESDLIVLELKGNFTHEMLSKAKSQLN